MMISVAFQDITLRLIAERLVPNTHGSVYMQGALVNRVTTIKPPRGPCRFHIYCSRFNHGAASVMTEISDALSLDLLLTENIQHQDVSEHMLVYLSNLTWTSGQASEAFAAEIHAAMDAGVHLLLVHEMSSDVGGQDERHGCTFDQLYACKNGATPQSLLRRGVYKQIAIAMKGGEWRRASMVMVASALAKSQLGEESSRRLDQTLSARKVHPSHGRLAVLPKESMYPSTLPAMPNNVESRKRPTSAPQGRRQADYQLSSRPASAHSLLSTRPSAAENDGQSYADDVSEASTSSCLKPEESSLSNRAPPARVAPQLEPSERRGIASQLESSERRRLAPQPEPSERRPKLGKDSAKELTAGKRQENGESSCAAELREPSRRAQLAALRGSGSSASAARALGYSAREEREAGYTAAETHIAGFTALEAKDAGYNASEMHDGGYSASELMSAGLSGVELFRAGFKAGELREGGCTLAELKRAGLIRR